jgi:hypothetical protein
MRSSSQIDISPSSQRQHYAVELGQTLYIVMLKLLLCLLLLAPHVISHAGFNDGVDAYLRKDYAKAFREWEPLAHRGDTDAARNLARLYLEGNGTVQDFKLARKWFQFAADRCNATAMNGLGLMLLNGQGGATDAVQSFRVFERAANMGIHADSDSMGNLAGMYLRGIGTQANIIEAYKWYLLYREYTTDNANKQKLTALLPSVESAMTQTQIEESRRRARSFVPTPCR